MLVLEDGRTLGTVGGGLLEVRAKEIAKNVLRERSPVCRTFSLAARGMEAEDMLCGGEVEILVDFLDAADSSCSCILERVLQGQEVGRLSWLARSIRNVDEEGHVRTGLGLLDEGGFDPGTLDLSCLDASRLKMAGREREPVLISLGDIRCFIQPVALAETLFLFGAGHIARELAPIASALGFRILVIDDCGEFAHAERFPQAAEILVTDSFAACFSHLKIDALDYIVIMTHAHTYDRTVLAGALKTPARYIGMIASQRKRDILYRSLREDGFSAETLARVHSPIGLDIGARNPAEIAVSIAAELVAVRVGKIC
jgi:xanthine dehydrogenase accessory factor